ncbi:hypothetical protein [Burkholderia ubonensis]|uniref:Uncharacterized protein n=1 Tax=Burkholderia ubonensis subsp. mesacidophila TaxID=265293 RepID=A0A2A4FEU0_9BURK|nr:hypothetical protein [Burkholderia ubonensis]PCE31645.1 hypothetical protein BZL54_14230 [Burkholderia ubonensis subsp. mesacidophila]
MGEILFPLVPLAFVLGLIALTYRSTRTRKRELQQEAAQRPIWAAETPRRDIRVRAFAYLRATLFAAFPFAGAVFVSVRLLGPYHVNSYWDIPAILLAGACIVTGCGWLYLCVQRVIAYSAISPLSRPALYLGDSGLRYFNLVEVPWIDIVETRQIDVSLGRGGVKRYVVLFMSNPARSYATGKTTGDRLQLWWKSRTMGLTVNGSRPAQKTRNHLFIDTDVLAGVKAPQLQEWIDRLRRESSRAPH